MRSRTSTSGRSPTSSCSATLVAAWDEKPAGRRREARWLEVHDAALFLEAARTYKPRRGEVAIPPAMAHAIVATFLLTGGRESEVLGLEVEDVSFDRGTVTFRPNHWRRLKTATSHRPVPLWPQLREILQQYLYGGEQPRVSGLLFPSVRHTASSSTRTSWANGSRTSGLQTADSFFARLLTPNLTPPSCPR